MDVEIFVTTKFKGRVTNGSGTYGIVRRLAGRPDTEKCHMTERSGMSYQEFNTYAAVEAIECMVAPAHVKIYLDSAYAAHMAEKGSADENANKELWDRFYKKAGEMESVKVEQVKDHEYAGRLLKFINTGEW